MASLKEIRTRIVSVKKTRQVTSAMKMVSAAKLKKAQDAILQIRPYGKKLQEIMVSLSGSLNNLEENPFGAIREPENILLVVITSNKGLCGTFNASVVKQTTLLANETYAEQNRKGNLKILTVGKNGYKLLSKNYNVIGHRNQIFDELNFENASEIAAEIMQNFSEGKYDRVELIYNQFKNAAVQLLTREQFLPIKMEKDDRQERQEYIFEPDKKEIVTSLIPKSLKIQFYKAILDSFAAEHGARMTAMHKATDNATDLIRDLNLHYNQARQASITNEILEIVSGAEALSQ